MKNIYSITISLLLLLSLSVFGQSRIYAPTLNEPENGELGLNDIPGSLEGEDDSTRSHVQLKLFRKPERLLIENLSNLDISTMTPLDALNYLDELGEKARNITR